MSDQTREPQAKTLESLAGLSTVLTAINSDENREALMEGARALRRSIGQPPVCEHCGLPLVCASAKAELIHAQARELDQALTRAETAEAALRQQLTAEAQEARAVVEARS